MSYCVIFLCKFILIISQIGKKSPNNNYTRVMRAIRTLLGDIQTFCGGLNLLCLDFIFIFVTFL
jgi:hypothetical protein